MIEPTEPDERALAIRICRVNAYLDPDTAEPMDHGKAQTLWSQLPELPYAKWIWMWNYGREEWDPRCSTAGKGESL